MSCKGCNSRSFWSKMRKMLRTKLPALLSAAVITTGFGLGIAAPANASIGGTVTCDAYSTSYPVVGVWIDSSNNAHDGWASWTAVPGQPWTASYSKGDVSESYKVHVGCGGTPSSWNQTAYSQTWLTGYQNFICHVSFVANQRICNS